MPGTDRGELATAAALALATMPVPAGVEEIRPLLPARLRDAGPDLLGAALRAHPFCVSVARGRYSYLPRAIEESKVYVPGPPSASGRALRLPPEAEALLWPEGLSAAIRAQQAAHVRLPSAGRATWRPDRVWITDHLSAPYTAGEGHWLSCVDFPTRNFRLDPCPPPDPGQEALREERWRAWAMSLMRPLQPYDHGLLARKLLGAGVGRDDPPCATMSELTAVPPFDQHHDITYRPDLTDAMWRLFRHRGAAPEGPFTLPPPAALDTSYRLQVRLAGGRWRAEIVLGATHSLDNLHLLLQRVLNWDDAHLYAFYLSGRPFDRLTAVACPMAGDSPPATDEVTLGHIDPAPGQRLLYLFDFGDEWRFELTVTERTVGQGVAGPPLCFATSGPPPLQYG